MSNLMKYPLAGFDSLAAVSQPTEYPVESIFPFLSELKASIPGSKEDLKEIRRTLGENKQQRIKDIPYSELEKIISRNMRDRFSYGMGLSNGTMARYILTGDMPYTSFLEPMWFFWNRLAFMKEAGKLKAEWENARSGFCDIEKMLNDNYLRDLSRLKEKFSKQESELDQLAAEGYFNPVVLSHHLPAGLVDGGKYIDTIYGFGNNLYSRNSDFLFVKLLPVLALPFSELAKKRIEDRWIITKAVVKSHGYPSVDINYERERHDTVTARGRAMGFLMVGLEVGVSHSFHDKTQIYSNRDVQIPLLLEKDGLQLLCSYNTYPAKEIFGISQKVGLLMQTVFEKDEPIVQMVHPNSLYSVLEGSKDKEVTIGGRMVDGNFYVDMVLTPKNRFVYFPTLMDRDGESEAKQNERTATRFLQRHDYNMYKRLD